MTSPGGAEEDEWSFGVPADTPASSHTAAGDTSTPAAPAGATIQDDEADDDFGAFSDDDAGDDGFADFRDIAAESAAAPTAAGTSSANQQVRMVCFIACSS